MNLFTSIDIPAPGLEPGVLALTLAAVAILFCLMVLIESVVLQLLGWGDLKSSIRASLLMNLASAVLGIPALGLAPIVGLWGLLVAWTLSVVIEALVLARMGPGDKRYHWITALLANLASFVVLILPIYLYSR